jgi:hypothetical protein
MTRSGPVAAAEASAAVSGLLEQDQRMRLLANLMNLIAVRKLPTLASSGTGFKDELQ